MNGALSRKFPICQKCLTAELVSDQNAISLTWEQILNVTMEKSSWKITVGLSNWCSFSMCHFVGRFVTEMHVEPLLGDEALIVWLIEQLFFFLFLFFWSCETYTQAKIFVCVLLHWPLGYLTNGKSQSRTAGNHQWEPVVKEGKTYKHTAEISEYSPGRI